MFMSLPILCYTCIFCEIVSIVVAVYWIILKYYNNTHLIRKLFNKAVHHYYTRSK